MSVHKFKNEDFDHPRNDLPGESRIQRGVREVKFAGRNVRGMAKKVSI